MTFRTGPTLPRRIVEAVCLTIALLAPFATLAANDYDSPAAQAMLPPYCRSTGHTNISGGRNPVEVQRLRGLMGESFRHMHHYCWGLHAVNEAISARTAQERNYLLTKSVGEFNYIIGNANPDFVMLPEIHTKRGESLLRIGKVGPAVADFLRAIELKADYWPPYVQLSDYYKQVGNLASAREWVEKGLSFAPNSRTLQERLAALDEATASPEKSAPRAGKSPQVATTPSDGGKPAAPPAPKD